VHNSEGRLILYHAFSSSLTDAIATQLAKIVPKVEAACPPTFRGGHWGDFDVRYFTMHRGSTEARAFVQSYLYFLSDTPPYYKTPRVGHFYLGYKKVADKFLKDFEPVRVMMEGACCFYYLYTVLIFS